MFPSKRQFIVGYTSPQKAVQIIGGGIRLCVKHVEIGVMDRRLHRVMQSEVPFHGKFRSPTCRRIA